MCHNLYNNYCCFLLVTHKFTSFHSLGLLQFFLFKDILVYGNIVIDKRKVSLLLATNNPGNALLYIVQYLADVIFTTKIFSTLLLIITNCNCLCLPPCLSVVPLVASFLCLKDGVGWCHQSSRF